MSGALLARLRGSTGLLGLLGVAVLSQVLIQHQAFTSNPGVLSPGSDAKVIWERAAEIAAGDGIADAPFETAPLPLWTAAAVRWLGFGLVGWGVLQSVFYVLAVGLVALATRALVERLEDVGPAAATRAGLVGGVFLVLNEDAAAATSRVLGGPLQLLLGSLWLLLALGGAGSLLRASLLGLATGLFALAFPPALGLIPFALSAARGRLGNVLATLVVALVAIAPATLHNHAACGEFVPISSQAGLTFYHGNNAAAEGVIAPVGVVNAKESQAEDSLRLAREALGADAGWNDASAYFRGLGLDWWSADPGGAFAVAATKLWYALSGRNYGDVVQPRRERADGTASRLWLAPLPTPWLVFPALFAGVATLLGCRRRLARALPALALFALPIAVCVVFFYTPRYRMPAIPALCALASLALVRARVGGRPAVLAAVSVLLGLVSGPLNRAVEFDGDPNGAYANLYAERMAQASGGLGWHDRGAAYLGALLAERPGDVQLRERLASLHWLFLDDPGTALRLLEDAPLDVAHTTSLVVARATILAKANDDAVADPDEALRVSALLVDALPDDFGILELRAAALARAGRFDEAVEVVDRALARVPAGDAGARAAWQELRVLYSAGQPQIVGPVR